MCLTRIFSYACLCYTFLLVLCLNILEWTYIMFCCYYYDYYREWLFVYNTKYFIHKINNNNSKFMRSFTFSKKYLTFMKIFPRLMFLLYVTLCYVLNHHHHHYNHDTNSLVGYFVISMHIFWSFTRKTFYLSP